MHTPNRLHSPKPLASGGNFWQGFGTGVTVAGLNHLMHKGDPLKANKDDAMTMKEWKAKFDGMSESEIKKIVGGGLGSGSGRPDSKNGRYVIDPVTGNVIDMKHTMIMGRYGKYFGTFWELRQFLNVNSSGGNPQDFFSNRLGYDFYASPYAKPTLIQNGYAPFVGIRIPPVYANDFAIRMSNFLINR